MKHCPHVIGVQVCCCWCRREFAFKDRKDWVLSVPGHGPMHPDNLLANVMIDEDCPREKFWFE